MTINNDDGNPTSPDSLHPAKTSALILAVLDQLPADTIRIDVLLTDIQQRSFGAALIILSLVSLIPGVSLFSGFIMVVLGLQMILGITAPRLPARIQQRAIDSKLVVRVGMQCIRLIRPLERLIKPRWPRASGSAALKLVGVVVVVLSLIVMLPLPLSNLPTAIVLIVIAAGLLERDGVMVVIGLFLSLIALMLGIALVSFAYETLLSFIEQYR